jgi:hypothetical protein
MKNSLFKLAVVGLLAFGLAGCENMSHRERNTAYGAGIGAVGGAAISGLTGGNVGTGALIGAGVGGVGGYLYDDGYHYDR